jgi:hypothetical protein
LLYFFFSIGYQVLFILENLNITFKTSALDYNGE